MQHITDFNPWLPDTQQVIPAREGGNGQIHQPGQFQNVIWQTRARVPDGFETALVAALEEIFEQGAEELAQIVSALNRSIAVVSHGMKPRSANSYTSTVSEPHREKDNDSKHNILRADGTRLSGSGPAWYVVPGIGQLGSG